MQAGISHVYAHSAWCTPLASVPPRHRGRLPSWKALSRRPPDGDVLLHVHPPPNAPLERATVIDSYDERLRCASRLEKSTLQRQNLPVVTNYSTIYALREKKTIRHAYPASCRLLTGSFASRVKIAHQETPPLHPSIRRDIRQNHSCRRSPYQLSL